jgi:sugar lactone lactonase YvrE
MKVDAERRLLWVCTGAVPNAAEVDSLALGRTGVFKYDLTTDRLVARYLLPDDGGEHWFGDLALAADGTVYVTDSQGGGIYTIEEGADSLALFLASEAFASLQGLDLSADQRHLYVADYARGVFKVDLATKALSLLPYPENATLLGIDGLYVDGNTLLVIQNGIRPHRVARAYLDGDATAITRVEAVEANHTSYDEPTLGAVVGDTLFYVANSQWGHFDAAGRLQPEQLSDPVVLRLVLR